MDPYLRILSSSGAILRENDDISSGVNRDSRISFTAPTTGTYEPPEADVFEAGQALVAKPSGTLMPCQCGRLLSQASGESINPAP